MTFQRDRASVEQTLINYNKKHKGGINMATIKDESESYIPVGKIKNVSELSEVSVDANIQEGSGIDPKTSLPFKYKFIEVNGERYRIPSTVLGGLKEILEEKPNMKKFKVKRKGTTKTDTSYTIIQLD